MKKYSKVLILLILFVLCPRKVSATCSNEEMTLWRQLAQNVTVSYDAVEKDGKVMFSITFANMNKDLEIYDLDNQKFYSSKKSEITITKNKDSHTYRFDLYSKDKYCGRISLYSVYADIPAYNPYHKDEVCKGIEDYALCKKWALIKYSYEDWKDKVISYKESLIPKEEEVKEKKKHIGIIEKIVDIYGDTYYIILPIVILGGIVWIYVYNKKRELF